MTFLAQLFLLSTLVAAAPSQDPNPTPAPPPIPADTDVKTTDSGMKYSVLTPGKGGRTVHVGDKARVRYTGWTTDGKVFDTTSNRGNQPYEVTVGVGQVIAGWDEALQLMTVGERIKITLPPALGYGERGMGKDIPPNATLIFEMELVDYVAAPEFHEARPDQTKTTASGLKYEVLTDGAGQAFDAAKNFSFKYALWNTSKKLLDCSDTRGGSVTSTVERLPFAFLKEGLPLMKEGARWRFEVPPALCFGDKAQGRDLPPNSVTIWEVELVKVIEPLKLPAFALTPDEKATKTASGLKYEVLREGTGAQAAVGKRVTVHYAGWRTDGTLFDASYTRNDPFVLSLPGSVIKGWNEGLLLMKEGSMYRFTIPAELGYGARGNPPAIKPNDTLVFVIEMLKVE